MQERRTKRLPGREDESISRAKQVMGGREVKVKKNI